MLLQFKLKRIQLLLQVLLTIPLILAASQMAIAQSVSKMELFGGYSLLWEHTKHAHGWNASFAFNANRWLSLVGGTSGHYPANETEFTRLSTTTFNIDQYRFYFGPRLSVRKVKNITPYCHLLLGVAHTRITTSGTYSSNLPPTGPFPFSVVQSTNYFSGAAGAGLDIKASERITVRLIRTEYVRDTGQTRVSAALSAPRGYASAPGLLLVLGKSKGYKKFKR